MKGTGWIRDLPDVRDFGVGDIPHPPTTTKLLAMGADLAVSRVDLRSTGFLSPIEDQGNLGSCTAHAVTGILEYGERQSFGKYLDHSRLFLYRVSRKLYYKTRGPVAIGDTGSEIRTTIKALAAIGSPPEWIWPYDETKFDIEPPPDAYAMAQSYKGLNYIKLTSLAQIKSFLKTKTPVAFGFTCYKSIDNPDVGNTGVIPTPKSGEPTVGGHAISAVGFDDNKGNVIIRNSWGTSWGDKGYGYLPYWYFDSNQADDFWVLLKSGWVDLD